MEIRVDNNRVIYRRHGEGEPMLLIHGMITYSFIWKNLLPGLSSRYDVIAPDLLGCGKSDKQAEDMSPEAQAEMIEGLMEKLDVESAHIVTHDIGGAVGQILAVRYPERVRDLTMINTVGYDFWPVQPIVTFRAPIIRQLAMAVLNRSILRTIVERGVYYKERVTDELMDEFYRPLESIEGRKGFLRLAGGLNNRQLMDIKEEIHALRMPVMIVRGDADVYLPPDIAETLHANIGGSRLERIETGGHLIQLDEPDWLVGLIMDFCKDAVASPL
jgi:pimeloyl-ACP methyl ester carboxylesterase